MTQKQLLIEYIREHGSVVPARLGGEVYLGKMFGSEITRRARELREAGVLQSEPSGKFERFYLPEDDMTQDERDTLNKKLVLLRKQWLQEQDNSKREVIKRQGIALRRALELEEYAAQVQQALA